ncbi:hypothetical protein WICMUC_004314 [Wickerhamomyces mucosus]|uniref:Uncharacterized protein n=1 Tax=Wickerhamomyces mucosus TaxID=1378264 RepID=A0A9P8PJC3_9ASCO|nr:hypothetical protein WICMUC_004314 [Wickerhamomyces mucosus]
MQRSQSSKNSLNIDHYKPKNIWKSFTSSNNSNNNISKNIPNVTNTNYKSSSNNNNSKIQSKSSIKSSNSINSSKSNRQSLKKISSLTNINYLSKTLSVEEQNNFNSKKNRHLSIYDFPKDNQLDNNNIIIKDSKELEFYNNLLKVNSIQEDDDEEEEEALNQSIDIKDNLSSALEDYKLFIQTDSLYNSNDPDNNDNDNDNDNDHNNSKSLSSSCSIPSFNSSIDSINSESSIIHLSNSLWVGSKIFNSNDDSTYNLSSIMNNRHEINTCFDDIDSNEIFKDDIVNINQDYNQNGKKSINNKYKLHRTSLKFI